jgi:hypothetical protein
LIAHWRMGEFGIGCILSLHPVHENLMFCQVSLAFERA